MHMPSPSYLLPRLLAVTCAFIVSTRSFGQIQGSGTDDKEKLGRAIEYFQSGKYHEALLLFAYLSGHHKLSPRLMAYMGVCSYYDMDYKSATRLLDSSKDAVSVYGPSENAVYLFCNAESHLNLKEYTAALQLYEEYALVCHDNERADAMYKMGTCHKELGNTPNAIEYMESAIACYHQFNGLGDDSEKILNARKIIDSCRQTSNIGTTFAK